MNRARALALTATMTLIGAGIAAHGVHPVAADPNDGGHNAAASVDPSRAIVVLVGEPLSTSAKTRPAPGKKVDFESAGTKSYRAELNERRKAFKAWLRANAPKVKVTGEFDISLNAVTVDLNGTTVDTLRRAPQVSRVDLEGVYTPLDADPDLSMINAEAAWTRGGGPANAGAGIKVGIVDTGIDITHPCFFDTSDYPPQIQLGDTSLTNNKVIVARVFNNRTNKRYTAAAIDDHGTHVAGTVACNYQTPATVDGEEIPYGISGVAPRALLGNYNVFPADVQDARSEDILNALDAAYADGMDVINMSLGGGAQGAQDLLTVATDNLDRANVVVAVAAGNDGPGADTVGSPGSAARALTAGASTVPHFVGANLAVGAATYGIATGDFAVVGAGGLTARLQIVPGAIGGLSDACTPLAGGSLTGVIAVITRGTCAFSVKITNAQVAGAAAVIVVNNVAGDPTAMGSDGTPDQPTIPAYMIGLAHRAAIVASPVDTTATISATRTYVATANANIMAGFSSQGPTDVTRRVKPDVVAPGVNVLSAVPIKDCEGQPCFAFLSGTSMASPHLAGSAAIVRQQHPLWTAAQVRSAIVNTATQGVLKDATDGASIVTNPNIVGAGLENLLAAVQAPVTLDPVSVSFGRIPSGSGKSRSTPVTITNTSNALATFTLATTSTVGTSPFKVVPSSVQLEPGRSATVTVSVATVKGQAANGSGSLDVSFAGSVVAHAVLFFEVG